LPIDDPIQRCPDIAQAEALLGWRPQTALEPGLKRTIAYFDRMLSDQAVQARVANPVAVA
jgi:UDP-glucuronate decarboxylase